MSLDQNLFTLNVVPDAANPGSTDLVDPDGNAHYRKQRVGGSLYRIEVLDPLSGAVLASASAPDATSKTKVIELFNPSHVVEFKSVGTLSFKWAFKWESHEFEWKREECYMVRKPDPAVLVAVTKEPPGRLRSSAVQILDYNLNRFDIEDRKGLEVVLLTALLTFHDLNDGHNGPPPTYTPSPPPPVVPPKPLNLDRLAEMQAVRGEVNEVTVTDEYEVVDYATYATKLLEDDAMLFISIRSEAAAHVPRVLAVVEETKRLRYKQGMDEDLHQYVVYDAKQPTRRGRINLDNPTPSSGTPSQYTPPESLTVHMSKIDMPELKPKGSPPPRTSTVRKTSGSRGSPPRAKGSPAAKKSPAAKPPAPFRSPSISPQPSPPIKPDRPSLSRILRLSTSHSPTPTPTPPPPPLPSMPSNRPAQPYASTAYHPPSSARGVPTPSPAQLSNPITYVGEPVRTQPRSFWGTKR